VQSQFGQARKLIGYCPQHDAIFDLVTVEEHLEYYARIKGIPPHLRQQLINQQIMDMNLDEHRKKPAGTLSGGNKRKLSVAMAIIGNPPIILLDEPSAGMDPEARRFMWTVVARISQQRKRSAVILTTHSMEEAEALSTKMGIMVKGGVFKCFGSSQHIKNKFATGYEIEVKIKKLTNEELKALGVGFGYDTAQAKNGEMVPLKAMCDIMKEKKMDPFLIAEIRKDGLGGDLVKEATEKGGLVNYSGFLSWLYVEQAGMGIINGLCDDFPTVEILEHYNDYYKIRIPRGDKSIGFVFGLIEERKEAYLISEYSVSQTTLEQIFQSFANMKIDDSERPKLTFKKTPGQSRAELYTEKAEVKRQFSKTRIAHNSKAQDY
jgi:ATP-binding cassette, subfamily A (ABC1), member 3